MGRRRGNEPPAGSRPDKGPGVKVWGVVNGVAGYQGHSARRINPQAKSTKPACAG